MTVYRIVKGSRCAFVGPKCFWEEYYASEKHDKADPNSRWRRAKHGQIEKCAEAGSLRAAFPEEIGNEYAAEEMEGQRILNEVSPMRLEPPIPPTPPAGSQRRVSPPVPPQPTNNAPPTPPDPRAGKPIPLIEKYREAIASAKDGDELDVIFKEIIEPHMSGMDREMYEAVMALDDARRGELENAQ